MTLIQTSLKDIEIILSWINSKSAVRLWGGPKVRYPFTIESICEDIQFGKTNTFSLVNEKSELLGIGQFFLINDERIHLARIIISPDHRGKGFGEVLCKLLIEKGVETYGDKKISLKVNIENHNAIKLYKKLGFKVSDTITLPNSKNESTLMILE